VTRILTCLLLLACSHPLSAQETPTPEPAPGRRLERSLRNAAGYSGNLGRFGGAVVASEASRAAASGNVDAVGDALRAPISPEFLFGLAVFDGSLRAMTGLTSRIPVLSHVGEALKQNLVLAGALTVTSAVEVDLGGLSYGDVVRGDLSALQGASVRLGDVDAQSLGITMGSFAIAQPIWRGARSLFGRLGPIVARRLAATAAIKAGLAVAPVPGTRVAALILTAGEVALAVGELAGLLTVAHTIEQPLQAANERRRGRNVLRQAEQVARSAPDADALQEALLEVRAARATERARAYVPVAREDLAMVRRMRDRGLPAERLNAIAQSALGDYGRGLALPAQTALLLEDLQANPPPGMGAAVQRHRGRVLAVQAAASRARSASYAAEDRFYAGLLRSTTTAAAREVIEAAREASRTEALVEREDLRPRLRLAPSRPQVTQPQRGITAALEGSR
jgi:hypothetical protein